jgi:Tol biopolymer transport system component
VETIPRRGYRFIAPVTAVGLANEHPAQTPTGPANSAALKFSRYTWTAGLLAAALLVAVAIALWSRKTSEPQLLEPTSILPGFGPALSRDGKLLAYVSTSGNENHFRIWLRQTAGGSAIPVTTGTWLERNPNFSPDGTLIAYYSDMNGGGIYLSPTLQGSAKLLAPCSVHCVPHFSPNGDAILFVDENSMAMTVPTRGGQPVPLPFNQNFQVDSSIFWGPDGDKVIFYGFRKGQATRTYRVWVSPIDGTDAFSVDLPGIEQDVASTASLRGWVRLKNGKDWLFYSHCDGNSWKLYRIAVSRQPTIVGAPEQLAATGTDQGILGPVSVSEDGKMVYPTANLTYSIFDIPTRDGRRSGPTNQLRVSQGSDDQSPSVSRDGRWMAYDTTTSDKQNSILLRDMTNGTDKLLDDRGRRPGNGGETSISPDGSEIIFERDCISGITSINDSVTLECAFMMSIAGGSPAQVCESCTPRGFSADGSILLAQKYRAAPDRPLGIFAKIVVIDLKNKTERDFLTTPDGLVFHPYFSWDDRWVSFKRLEDYYLSGSRNARILISRVRHGVAADENQWVTVTNGQYTDDKPQFSADGKTLYFVSTRDGYLCIWAQRLDPQTKHPIGPPYAFEHFHNAMGHDAATWPDLINGADLTIGLDRMLISLPQFQSSLHMLQLN